MKAASLIETAGLLRPQSNPYSVIADWAARILASPSPNKRSVEGCRAPSRQLSGAGDDRLYRSKTCLH